MCIRDSINTGLHHCKKERVNILEIGFGTGLNAFLTALDVTNTEKNIHYTGLELYPLPKDVYKRQAVLLSHSVRRKRMQCLMIFRN